MSFESDNLGRRAVIFSHMMQGCNWCIGQKRWESQYWSLHKLHVHKTCFHFFTHCRNACTDSQLKTTCFSICLMPCAQSIFLLIIHNFRISLLFANQAQNDLESLLLRNNASLHNKMPVQQNACAFCFCFSALKPSAGFL